MTTSSSQIPSTKRRGGSCGSGGEVFAAGADGDGDGGRDGEAADGMVGDGERDGLAVWIGRVSFVSWYL